MRLPDGLVADVDELIAALSALDVAHGVDGRRWDRELALAWAVRSGIRLADAATDRTVTRRTALAG